ncbi:unnamed protein product [Sphagnum compactum]
MLQKAPHAKEDNEKQKHIQRQSPRKQKVLDAMCAPARTVSDDAPLVYWILRSESNCPRFSLRNVFIIITAGAAAVYRMQRLSKPREQHLHPHIGQSELHQKALAATLLCALAIALYPSTTFADAENMIKAMRCKPCVAARTALLSACRIHGNVEMGEHFAKQILALEPENAAGHVLLSKIHAAAGNRHFCENVEQQRKKRGVKKQLSLIPLRHHNQVLYH